MLCWPVLRTVAAAGRRVGVVSASSRANLAADCLGVVALPDHQPAWSGLWAGVSPSDSCDKGVSLVLAFGERPTSWRGAVVALFPVARVVVEAGTLDRVHAAEVASRVACTGGVVMHGGARACQSRTVVLHAGSGGVDKQWPLARWIELAGMVTAIGLRVVLLAGEAERERWDTSARGVFESAGGRFLESVDDLARTIGAAAGFAGADCGPSHLAGQLGVPTLVLFGPSDPRRWSPVGPCVRVVRSADGTMSSIGVDEVFGALTGMIAEAQRA